MLGGLAFRCTRRPQTRGRIGSRSSATPIPTGCVAWRVDLAWLRAGEVEGEFRGPGPWPFGITAYAGREDNDLVLWLPSIDAIVTGDSLSDFGDGLDIQLGGRRHVTREDVVGRLRPLLGLPVEPCCPRTAIQRTARRLSACFPERAGARLLAGDLCSSVDSRRQRRQTGWLVSVWCLTLLV